MKIIAALVLIVALTGCKDDAKWNNHPKRSNNKHQMYF
jgi:uncharacterized lipoprotein YehR (DUF1307 family)